MQIYHVIVGFEQVTHFVLNVVNSTIVVLQGSLYVINQ